MEKQTVKGIVQEDGRIIIEETVALPPGTEVWLQVLRAVEPDSRADPTIIRDHRRDDEE